MQERERLLFTETEAGELVRRAAELQEQGSEKGYIPGISLDELKQMAAEVGVDPEFLLKAISEQSKAPEKPEKRYRVEEIERVLPVEIDPEDFDKLTENLKLMSSAYTGVGGALRQVGRTIEGQVSAGLENPKFKVTSRDGRTKLRVWQGSHAPTAMSLIFLMPMFIALMVAIAVNPLVGAVLMSLFLLLAFITFAQVTKTAQNAVKRVADVLEAAIMEHGKSAEEELQVLEKGKPKGPTPAG